MNSKITIENAKPEPKVAIIILNYNGQKHTLDCHQSLKQITYENYRIFLIDNNSHDNEKDKIGALERDEKTSIFFNRENTGFAKGCNMAIQEAIADKDTEYVVTLNNDTIVNPEFLSELVRVAQDNPAAGMIAPTILNLSDNKVDRLGLIITKGGLAYNRIDTSDGPIFCPSGCCALYSRKLLEELHEKTDCFFDPDFFCYGEDFDLGFRAQLLGFTAVFAQKSVVHHIGSSSITTPEFALYHCHRNILWSLVKNLPLPLMVKNLHWILMAQFGGLLKRIGKREFWVVWKAKFDGLRGFPRMIRKRRKIQQSTKANSFQIPSLMASPFIRFSRPMNKK